MADLGKAKSDADDVVSTRTLVLVAVGSLCAAAVAGMSGGCTFSPASLELDASPPVMVDAGALDATSIPDAAPDALADLVTLRETATSSVVPGSSVVCYAPGAQTTADGTWRRVFRLADFGVVGTFRVTGVSFGVSEARGARAIVVAIGTYAGAFGAAKLDVPAIQAIAATTVDVADVPAAVPRVVAVPIDATVAAGSLLVATVAAPNLRGAGSFHLGATTSGETAPGYFSSVACAFSPPGSTIALGGSGQLVLEVTGLIQ